MKSRVLAIAVVIFAVFAVAAVPAQTKGWASSVHVVFFPGGSPGGPFETVVYNGARQAEMDLGCRVDYVWSGWDPQRMIQQFQEAVATRPDGICVMGHPGDAAFDPLIADAEAKGIIVTSGNTQLPKAEALYSPNGFGYVGAELYQAGHDLGAQAVKRFGLKAGDRAMVWGLLSQPARGERTRGILDAFKEANLKVDYLEIDPTTNNDAPAGAPTFAGYVSSHPDVKAVVFDHGNLTSITENLMKAAGKQPGQVKAAGFDLTPGSIAAIKSGYLGLVIDQQEWLQGYLPVLQVCLTKMYGFSGLHVNTGAGFVDQSNVNAVAPLAARQIR
jgi:simple sugar transport system substrate-binding protein